MKTKTLSLFKQATLLVGVMFFATLISCKDDEKPTPNPVASFQFEISTENFLEVTFTNYSLNATNFTWDFGDGETSSESDPVHTFSETGDYIVELTAENDDGAMHSFSSNISIEDPDVALARLAGETSKTWKLYRIEASMGVGPNLDDPYQWFSLTNDGSRPCKYFHEFTFTRQGEYIFDDKGFFWSEGITERAKCIEATPENMINLDGEDVSAWLGGTHQFEYVASTGTVTLIGQGAWFGLPKVATEGEVTVPQNSVSFKIEITEHEGYDHMFVKFIYSWGAWVFNYVSYSNASLEPEVVSFFVDFSFEVDEFTVTFENQSKDAVSYSWDFGDGNTSTEKDPIHTYTAEGAYEVVLTGTSATGDTKEAKKDVTISLDPTESAPTPNEPEAEVISIFSDAYTDISGVNLNPNWGQATVTTVIDITEDDEALKMAGLNYQGIDWSDNAQDVSGKTMLHVDIYSSSVTDVNISLIGGGEENPVEITTVAGEWKSIDIPLSEYTDPDLTEIIQLKFDATGSPTIFVDNIYFY